MIAGLKASLADKDKEIKALKIAMTDSPLDNDVLRLELESLRKRLRWRKWPNEKPKDGVAVLVRYKNQLGNSRTVKGCWIPKLFDEAGEFSEADEDWFDYVEETDTYYAPEGWYELTENDEAAMCQLASDIDYEWLPIPTESPDTGGEA